MNWVDLVIVIVFILYAIEGLWKGLVQQVLDLAGFVLTIFIAIWLYKPVGAWVVSHIGIREPMAGPVAFLLVWFVFQGIVSLGTRFLLPVIPSPIRSAKWNRWLGVLPAVVKAFIVVAVIVTLTVLFPVPDQLKSQIGDSYLGSRFLARSSVVEGYLNKIFGRDLRQSLTFLTVPAQTEEIVAPDSQVDLKFKTTQVTVDKTSEQQMLVLVNQERAKAGLAALAWDEDLAKVARAHSTDMFARGYFAHKNPDGLSPFDRMANAGITFKAAGENLAYAATVELAHGGLMRSPGHRANILEKDFGRVGIGIIDAGPYGKMFTQSFRD